MQLRGAGGRDRLGWHLPVAGLILGTLALGVLAWWEGQRAQQTADVLMRGYAGFIADKFEEEAADRFQRLSGIHYQEVPGFPPPPFEILRSVANGTPAKLPSPSHDFIRYYFAYEQETGAVLFSGENVSSSDRQKLLEAIGTIPQRCVSERLTPYGQLEQWQRGEGDSFGWSGLTRSKGGARQVFGFRVDQALLAKELLFPLVDPSGECDCPSQLLPSNLASVTDLRNVARLTLRDAAGRIIRRTGDLPDPSRPVVAQVSRVLPGAIPFPGWTLEVAIRDEASRSLLPFHRRTPWAALVLLGLVVGGSGTLAARALRRNQELLGLRQDFVSNVSHELKTPLARIRLFNELLASGKQRDAGRSREYRQVIDRECRRLTFLIENILNFSRREKGACKPRRTQVEMKSLVEEAMAAFRTTTIPGQVTLTSTLQRTPTVLGDPLALQQAVVNLLDNAVKYSPKGETVEVVLVSRDEGVRLEIKDRGRGVPRKERQRIFREFYRIESGDRQEVSGSGLGLSLVHRTVRDHGGDVSVRGRRGGGSVFVVELPVAASNSADASPAESPARSPLSPLAQAAPGGAMKGRS